MIADGEKWIETRSWGTAYRGPLLICSTKRPTGLGPTGRAMAVATLLACRPMLQRDEAAAGCERYPGAVAWVLHDVRSLSPRERFAVRGHQRIYRVAVPGDHVVADYVRNWRRGRQCD